MTKAFSAEIDELVGAFGGIRKMASALGHRNHTTVQGWKQSGRIPVWRRSEIEAACRIKNISLNPSVFVSRGAE